jgi:hypothetical protein
MLPFLVSVLLHFTYRVCYDLNAKFRCQKVKLAQYQFRLRVVLFNECKIQILIIYIKLAFRWLNDDDFERQ